jgi:esterase/lipase
MTRYWIPGWQFSPASLEPLLTACGDSSDQVLSYHEAKIDRDAWLTQQIEKLPNGCQLVGWSLGGMLACELAARTDKVQQVRVLNANVKFSGDSGLATKVADNFMMRYRRGPEITRNKFAALVDRRHTEQVKPHLLDSNQIEKLEWLYDIDLTETTLKAELAVMLAEHDQLVPATAAKQAWTQKTSKIDLLPGEHSLPLMDVERVSQWVTQHG